MNLMRIRIPGRFIEATKKRLLLFYSSYSTISSPSSETIQHQEADQSNSSANYLGIGKSVINRLFCISRGDKVSNLGKNSSLKTLLNVGIHLSPETCRRYWRHSVLSPQDFLEILLEFSAGRQNSSKVDFLWKLFQWAGDQSQDFHHLPKSYQLMMTMLIEARILGKAESLLLSAEAILVDSDTYSKIIHEYAEACKLDNAIGLYDLARSRGIAITSDCYHSLLDLLLRMDNPHIACKVFVDMIEQLGPVSCIEVRFLDYVVGELTESGRIVEAINLLRKVKDLGIKPSPSVLTGIVEACLCKRDYDGVIKFLTQWEHVPEARVCNRFLSTLCRKFGAQEAWLSLQKIEALGFNLDARTFGILISQSCREGRLRDAFIFLSETLSRGIKPEVHAYNALLCGVFNQSMHNHARIVFDDMVEKEIRANLSTYEILLAGFCKYRKLDEVKIVLSDMINCGLINTSTTDDAFAKAISILGLDDLEVKLKRDNDFGFPRAEFFDSLGNGLYLETDLEEYEKRLSEIIDKKMVPSFEPAITTACLEGDVKTALKLNSENMQWSNTLSLSTSSKLIKCLCSSPALIREDLKIFDEETDILHQLDYETANMLVRALSENSMTKRGIRILDGLSLRGLEIQAETYCSLIMGLCEERNISRLQSCLELASSCTWLTGCRHINICVTYLCSLGLVYEALSLYDVIIKKFPNLVAPVCRALTKEFCLQGFGNAGCLLVEELLVRNIVVDNMTYLNLVIGFLKDQKFCEAHGIIDMLLEKEMCTSADAYKVLVPPLVQQDKLEKAMDLKASFISNRPEDIAFAYDVLIFELCKNIKLKEAANQLQEMLACRIFPISKNLNALVQGYCQLKNLERSLELLSFMLRRNTQFSFSSFRSLVQEMCMQNKGKHAMNLHILLGKSINSTSLALYNILIFHLVKTENIFLVGALLTEIKDTGLVLDEYTYNVLIYGYYKQENIYGAVDILYTTISKGLRPSNRSIRIVIRYLCSHGMLDEALQLSILMQRNRWVHSTTIQTALVDGLVSHSRFSEAELFLDQMEENDLVPKNINYDILIKHLCMHGRVKKAVDLLNIMLKMRNIPSESSYNALICRLCFCKELHLALSLYIEMQEKDLQPSSDASDVLIQGLCTSGETDTAKEILTEMVSFGGVPTYRMYKLVLDIYYEEDNLGRAAEVLSEMQKHGYSPDFSYHWSLISNLSSSVSKKQDDKKGFLSLLLSEKDVGLKNSKAKSVLGRNSTSGPS